MSVTPASRVSRRQNCGGEVGGGRYERSSVTGRAATETRSEDTGCSAAQLTGAEVQAGPRL